MPAAIRARGPEAVAEFVAGKDWSHITTRRASGSDLAANRLWEDSALNRARGAVAITAAEMHAAHAATGSEALRAALAHTAGNAVGALAGAAMSAVLGVLEEGLRGEITADQMIYAVGRRMVGTAAAGAAGAGLATLAVSTFPALAPVLAWVAVPLAAPAAKVGLGAAHHPDRREVVRVVDDFRLEAPGVAQHLPSRG